MARDPADLRAEEHLVEASVRHLAGAADVDLAPDQCVAVCLVRDGRYYVDDFIDHHLQLGVEHIVFLDNGSSDGTLDKVVGRSRVSVFGCDLPYRGHKLAMKRWLVRRFGRTGWALCVDADEHFDYPFSSRIPLRRFLAYLNAHDCDAVRALMLDLFPRESLRESWETDRWRDLHRYYEVDSLRRRRLVVDASPPIDIFWNGVRGRLGVPRLCLTKFPLVRCSGGVRFLEQDAHLVSGANEADVSTLLLHYKFAPCFSGRVADALEHKQYFAESSEYVHYDAALRADPDLCLWTASARSYDSVDDLAGTEYLTISSRFRAWFEIADP